MSGLFAQVVMPARLYGMRWRGPHLIIEHEGSYALSGYPCPGPTC